MSRHEVTAEEQFQAPPEKIFRILSDLERLPKWMPNVKSAQAVGSKKGLGQEGVMHLRFHEADVEAKSRTAELEEPFRLLWELTDLKVDGKPVELVEDLGFRFVLTPRAGGTRVAATARFTPKALKVRLAAPLIGHEVKKQLYAALLTLKKMSEAKK